MAEQSAAATPLIEPGSIQVDQCSVVNLSMDSYRPRSSRRSTTPTPNGQLTLF
jgi:hypothetical protein